MHPGANDALMRMIRLHTCGLLSWQLRRHVHGGMCCAECAVLCSPQRMDRPHATSTNTNNHMHLHHVAVQPSDGTLTTAGLGPLLQQPPMQQAYGCRHTWMHGSSSSTTAHHITMLGRHAAAWPGWLQALFGTTHPHTLYRMLYSALAIASNSTYATSIWTPGAPRP